MKIKYILALIPLMMVGCITAGQNGMHDPSLTLDDVLTFAADGLGTLGEQVNNLTTTLADAEKMRVGIEAIVGPIDTNNDGVISDEEAVDAYNRLNLAAQNNPTALEYLMDPNLLIALAALVTGGKVAKKAATKVPWMNTITVLLSNLAKAKAEKGQPKI